ncbi:MAG: hypothetical protein ACI8Z1_003530, partial [Candidatus Azotimanducaceae bacterium]
MQKHGRFFRFWFSRLKFWTDLNALASKLRILTC